MGRRADNVKIVIGIYGIPEEPYELEHPITEEDIADLDAILVDNGVEE